MIEIFKTTYMVNETYVSTATQKREIELFIQLLLSGRDQL
jgi:hypothetical protein